jgi:hypothetical protein
LKPQTTDQHTVQEHRTNDIESQPDAPNNKHQLRILNICTYRPISKHPPA